MTPIATYTKDPQSTLDYQIDWSEWLADGDTISASQWTVPSGLTEESSTNTTTTATVLLSGGDLGVTYAVANRITTAAGLIVERTIALVIADR
jgi:hypothetical protein